jgi:hypothetical protein
MKDLKEGIQDSVFPVKLFCSYVLFFTFVTGIIDGPIAGLLSLGFPYPEDYALSFADMLALTPALLTVIFLVLWNFRRMFIFAILAGCIALWFIWIIWESYRPGFDTDFPNNFEPWGLLYAGLFFAVPFVVIYLVWRFWPRRGQSKPTTAAL